MASPTSQEIAIDAAVTKIDQQFNVVRLLTPTNLHKEQARFFAGKIKNPTFVYRTPKADFAELVSELEELSAPDTVTGELLQKKIDETIAKLKMLMAMGTPEFTRYSKLVYGEPDAAILKDAHDLMKTADAGQAKSLKKQPKLTSEAVAMDLRDVIEQYGLKGWEVIQTEDIISGVVVAASEKRVYVHSHTSLDLSRLGPIITHEIETHVLTTVNGQAQPLKTFVQGFAGYTRTQEGLASYNVEAQHPELFHRPARFWSRNAIGVDVAQRGSFRDVYEHMRELNFNEHFSFGVAAKVKRGLMDTSKPGGLTKDYVYLAGRRDIMDFVASGGDLRDLYIGKILLSDLGKLKKQPWLVKPKVLPRFLAEQA